MHDVNQNEINAMSQVQYQGDNGWPQEEDEVVMDEDDEDEEGISESVTKQRTSTIAENKNIHNQFLKPEEIKQTTTNRHLETDESLETGGQMEDDIDEGTYVP